jgi:hypothetical protein
MTSKLRGTSNATVGLRGAIQAVPDPQVQTPRIVIDREHTSMISSGSFLLVGLGSVTSPASHQQSCIMLGPVRTVISTRDIWGEHSDWIQPVPQPFQPRDFDSPASCRLVWRACLIIVSDLWRREAVQKRGPDPQELTDGTTRLAIRGLESRTQSARFNV